MIVTAKLVAIGLGLALTAFTVSTIVLAVQKANLKSDLRDAQEKLDLLEAGFTTTAAPTTGSTANPGSTSSPDPTASPGSTASPGTTASPDPTASPGSTASPAPTASPGTTSEPGTTASPAEKIDYRLPGNLIPTHYDLYLFPNIETGEFSGQETITITVAEATDKIVLHSLNLNISSVAVMNTGSDTLQVLETSFDDVREFLTFQLSEPLTQGREIRLHLGFEGSMANKIVGLYSSSYVKEDETRKWIATSKFEPTYARQAFPCFDEPALKAEFTITLVHPSEEDYHALSNMNVESTVPQGAFQEVTFAKSVPMSTYLACFIVSDFQAKQVDIDTKGIGETFTMSVYATPEQLDKTDLAVVIGKGVIEYYIDYFQIAYPLPKLDMAAIPDFVSGAMEHWGLVTYRETSLLYDEETSSATNKQRIASVIAHEFAHMWFGNLVTMNWWNDLWLNEGFASFIEYLGVDAVYPEWKMRDQFIVSTLHAVLTLDGTLGSHPIIQTVENPDQITEIFDTITYSKGSSLVRMLEDFLGETTFRQAVTNYLNEYKYSTAETSNFFTEIDKLELGYNVTDIMLTWTVQMGLPVVTIEKVSDTEYKLTQKRFLSNPNDYDADHEPSEFNYRWSIPITYTTSSQSEVQRAWFYHSQSEITVTLPAAVQWIKFNADQVGYYRVNYAADQWKDLADQLVAEPSSFSAGDRASLLNDAFALADSTQLPYETAFELTRYLAKEADYVPWSVAASRLTSLKRTLYYTTSYAKYKKYATALIEPIYTALTWTVGEDHLDNRLRVTALSAACSLGLESCLSEAGQQFSNWLAKPEDRPNADVRETVYYYGIQSVGEQEVWDVVWELFVNESDASEKSKLMYGLSAVQTPWILKRYIDLAWNETYVRGQDYFTCLTYISANPAGESLVWDYVRENWQRLVDRFGLNERYLGNLIPSITARFSTQTKLEEMEQFFAKYPEAGAGTAARVRALETVKNNIVWLAENLEGVDAWLDKQEL
ncbi:glutamyl aminopeptidase [Drosophila ficusphila]|uniref:glutamyl aminopeptidase n=1 Tax=Drosophila ficusphila TaxID=30025 RepID=UPI001C89BE32|nr:glutamyl aminopeptidase [Drosophila ficusphila]